MKNEVKDKFIKFRISLRDKEIIREIARDKKLNMTDIIMESVKNNYPEYFKKD